MVNSDEIMIGNQFMVGEDVVVVDEIFDGVVSLQGNEFTTFTSILEAIPISEEILLKNGFNKNLLIDGYELYDDFIEYEKQIDGFFISFRKTSNTIDRDWYIHIDNSDRATCGGCDVQYIHQIQNMANILGFKIEFELQ